MHPLHFSIKPVLVLGDLILDIYLKGSVGRISPEAPVPILSFSSEEERLGGAANVALNIASIGGQAKLIGIVGNDTNGHRLRSVLSSHQLSYELVSCDSCPTISKTRVIAGSYHQYLRIDKEDPSDFPRETEDALLDLLNLELTKDVGAVILSDYAKGCLSDYVLEATIAKCRAYNIPVLVDPKRKDFAAYNGASFIKPNLNELEETTGANCRSRKEIIEAATSLSKTTGANILLTMSEQGIAFFPATGDEPEFLPTNAKDVFDVSGAGDTVISIFGSLVAGGTPTLQAMHAANVAAGIVVSKVGTATLDMEELKKGLRQDLRRSVNSSNDKFLDWDNARDQCSRWQENGLVVGFTNGCFDLLHPGHIRLLTEAASHCDKLIVGLNTDASTKRLKGEARPVQSENARMEVMAALSVVDSVLLFDEDTPLEVISHILPNIVIKGADYSEHEVVGGDIVKARGGKVVLIPLKEGYSTTRLIDHMNDDIDLVKTSVEHK